MKIADIDDWVEETDHIKELFQVVGCDLVGVAPVAFFPELWQFETWLDRGFAGDMDYLHRHLEKSLNPYKILPSVESILVCGQVYETDFPHSVETSGRNRGWISRYAWGDDYHDILLKTLKRGIDILKARYSDLKYRVYVDTGPTRDRVWGRYAGLGWFGKNSCLINQEMGSYFFIGEIFLNLPLKSDHPVADRCGTCTRCIDSCPTGAIVADGVVDARRCISYLTIETKSPVPEELRPLVGNHVFGCDICQDVCPWNRNAVQTKEPGYIPREKFFNPDLGEFYKLVRDGFPGQFRKSPLKRSKQTGLFRNLAVAMGNSGEPANAEHLKELLSHEDEGVRELAAWALDQLKAGT